MGRATRWFKSLFGRKTTSNLTTTRSEPNNSCYGADRKLIKSTRDPTWICHNRETIPPNITPEEAAWIKSCFPDSPEHQDSNDNRSKHAIAVAAATAAAADAAVAAAKAAAEVVRLTTNNGPRTRGDNHHQEEEEVLASASASTSHDVNNSSIGHKLAVVKIQTTFRGYLARKALRALKGLVKIQALVRGYLVRKQATATFQGMQALIRAQAGVRSKRASQSQASRFLTADPAVAHRHSMEGSSDPPSSLLHRRRLSASFDHTRSTTIINNPIAASFEENDSDPNPKVVEVDTGRPRPRSSSSSHHHRRAGAYHRHISMSELGEDPSSYQSLLPPHFHFQPNPRLSSVPTSHMRYHQCHHCCPHHPDPENEDEEEYYYGPSPAHTTTTPRRFSRYAFTSTTGGGGIMSSPAAPPPRSKDHLADHHDVVSLLEPCWPPGKYFNHYYGYNHPNYMANTQSFKAKTRSHSAPRQRPHDPPAPPGWCPNPGAAGGYSYRFSGISHSGTLGSNINTHHHKKRVGLDEMMINRGRTSLSGVGMQRSCCQAQETSLDFKNAVMGRLGSNHSNS